MTKTRHGGRRPGAGRPKGTGRPIKNVRLTEQIGVPLDPATKAAFEAICKAEGITPAERLRLHIEEAVRAHIER